MTVCFTVSKMRGLVCRSTQAQQLAYHCLGMYLYELVIVQECDSQLQRALNYENYEAAQEIRKRRTEVDEALGLIQVCKRFVSQGALFKI
jgi:hypothetical protein